MIKVTRIGTGQGELIYWINPSQIAFVGKQGPGTSLQMNGQPLWLVKETVEVIAEDVRKYWGIVPS